MSFVMISADDMAKISSPLHKSPETTLGTYYRIFECLSKNTFFSTIILSYDFWRLM